MSQEKEIKKEQEEVEEALKENEAQSEDAVENENTVEASKETADADTTDKASEEVKEEGRMWREAEGLGQETEETGERKKVPEQREILVCSRRLRTGAQDMGCG